MPATCTFHTCAYTRLGHQPPEPANFCQGALCAVMSPNCQIERPLQGATPAMRPTLDIEPANAPRTWSASLGGSIGK